MMASRRPTWCSWPNTAVVASAQGGAYPLQALPALLSRKINRPVMMRISRAEGVLQRLRAAGIPGPGELGLPRTAAAGRRSLVIQENGACQSFFDFRNAADGLSILYQPEAMRWRGMPVYANSIIRSAQRGPGYNQIAHIMEPLLDKAARELKIDRLAIRLKERRRAPGGLRRQARDGLQLLHQREALEKGAAKFGWQERLARHGQNGSR
jgi:CO/xanthine dehydrogenase Mo-binding subunit